jgi:predicted acetyltransferase
MRDEPIHEPSGVATAPREWPIRVPSGDEMRSFIAPLRDAYAEDLSEAYIDSWLETVEPERWLGVVEAPDSDVVLGAASAHSVRLTVPGGDLPAAAVTGVGTRPDHHRRGILRALMRRQLDDVRDRGEPLAILWASEGAIYQRFGYGLAVMDGYFEVPTMRTAWAREWPREGRVRLLREEESAQVIPPIYEAMRKRTPAAITRSKAWWTSGTLADPEFSRQGASHKYRLVYEADGHAEGYAIYRIRDDWDHRGPKSVMEVREAVANTPRALRGLWRFLFEVDLVRTVKAFRQPLPNPLQHLLAEPRALGMVANDGLWVRLVDLPAALAGRRYATSGALVVEVADAFCPWNAGRWSIEASGEPWQAVARVERTTAPAELVMDTTDLAAIYLGGTRPLDLADAGRIEERDAGALRRATALFAAERAPWCVMMF